MQIVTKCNNCDHESSLQGSTKFVNLVCSVCGFERPWLESEKPLTGKRRRDNHDYSMDEEDTYM